MTTFTCRWGLYPWVDTMKESLIHPDDLEEVKRWFCYGTLGCLFHCLGKQDGYLILDHGAGKFRTKPNQFRPIPMPPKFSFGQRVREVTPPHRTGVVKKMNWHFKRGAIIYILEVKGRLTKKWNFEQDLEPAEL